MRDLTDSAEKIREKIRKAKTDSEESFQMAFEDTEDGESRRPEVLNMITIWAALEDADPVQIARELDARNASLRDFKADLADVVVAHIQPIGDEISRVVADHGYVENVLRTGGETAAASAEETMVKVRAATGLS